MLYTGAAPNRIAPGGLYVYVFSFRARGGSFPDLAATLEGKADMQDVPPKPTPKAAPFKLRAQMLEQGRSDTVMARSDSMVARLKVYASGGENALHTHAHEDHLFLILQGSARFYDETDAITDVPKNSGILLPAGAFYRFEATSTEPLVLFRVGAKTSTPLPGDASRLAPDGRPLPGNSKENKRVPVIVKEGEWFE